MTRTRLILAIVLAVIILPPMYIWHIRTIDIEVKDNKIFVDGQNIAQKNYSAGFFGQLYGQEAQPQTDFSTIFLDRVYGKDSKGRGLRKFLAAHGWTLNQNLVIHFNSGQTMDRYLTVLQNIIWPTNYEMPWSWSSDIQTRSLQIASLFDVGVSPGLKRQITDEESNEQNIQEQILFFRQHMSVYLTGTDADGHSVRLAMTRELPMLGTVGQDVVKSEFNSGANESIKGINQSGKAARAAAARAGSRKRSSDAAKKALAMQTVIERQVSLIVTKQDVLLIKMDSVVFDIAAKEGGFDLSALPSQLESAIRGDSTGMIFVGSDADVDVGWILTILQLIQKTPSPSSRSLSDRVSFGRNIHISKDKILHEGEPLAIHDPVTRKMVSTLFDQLEIESDTRFNLESKFGVEFDNRKTIVIDQSVTLPIVRYMATRGGGIRPILVLPNERRAFTCPRQSATFYYKDIIQSNLKHSKDGKVSISDKEFLKQDIDIMSDSGRPDFQKIREAIMPIARAIQFSDSKDKRWSILVDPNDSVEVSTLVHLMHVLRNVSVFYDNSRNSNRHAEVWIKPKNLDDLLSNLGDPGTFSGDQGGGRLAISRVSISGSGSGYAADIQSVIEENGTAINSCYQKELKKAPDLKGALSIQIKINQAGKVAGVTTTKNTVGEKVGQCVTNKIRGWSFPKGKKGVVMVDVTFTFDK